VNKKVVLMIAFFSFAVPGLIPADESAALQLEFNLLREQMKADGVSFVPLFRDSQGFSLEMNKEAFVYITSPKYIDTALEQAPRSSIVIATSEQFCCYEKILLWITAKPISKDFTCFKNNAKYLLQIRYSLFEENSNGFQHYGNTRMILAVGPECINTFALPTDRPEKFFLAVTVNEKK
jgi:hypothetical protein